MSKRARYRGGRLITALLMIVMLAVSALGVSTYVGNAAAPKIKVPSAPNDNTYQTPPFSQNWNNTGLITVDDNWSGVPGIVGYRGDDLTTATGTDPQTILADGSGTPVDVNANQTNPNTFTTGGITEFELTDPTIAFQGSGTADAPFIVIYLNTTGLSGINVAYNLRDLDSSTDNAIQQVALHYRVGNSGSYTNIPEGYVADATTGPSLATLVTPVNVILPAAANNQAMVELRIMTTNAVGNDEAVGVDDIVITSGAATATPTTASTSTATNTGTPPTSTSTRTPTAGPTPGPLRIHDIQGSAHLSTQAGSAVVNVPGIVTAKISNGFYFQDPNPDANDATSEGLFVFTSSAPTVNVGDSVLVSGNIQEFRPGGATSANLTNTEVSSPVVSVLSTGNTLPAPIVVGTGGRIPPNMAYDTTNCGNVETCGSPFNPATDGIDFCESLEAMRVQVNSARVVGPTVQFSSGFPNREVYVVGDNGANSNINTPRGGVIARQNDQNPERIVVTNMFQTLPDLSVSDTFNAPIIGIMDYDFGKFLLHATTIPSFTAGNLPREITPLTPAPNELTIGNFNVENLDPTDPITKFNNLASLIVVNMKAPDVISVQEIQDNNGATDNGVVDASQTWGLLISRIQAAGGPTYQYRDINPVNDADGGEPGGNIRQGFLFRTDRGLTFVDRPGGNSTNSNTVQNVGGQPQLQFSPGRLDPGNSAFNASRKPLAAEFLYNGRTLFLIANHFNSKGGDDPLFAKNQPPIQSSQVQRNQQAAIVANFVTQIFGINSNALVMVLGDLNDFEYSAPLTLLRNAGLTPLLETLPVNERYSYDFVGNSQSLDHQFASSSFVSALTSYDSIHVNSEYAVQDSDHDPEVGYFLLPAGATLTPTRTNTAVSTSTSTASSTTTNTATATRTSTITASPTATTCVPGISTWVTRNPAPTDSYGAQGAGDSTNAYFAGGYSFTTGQTLDQFLRFNPTTNTWTTLTPMTQSATMPGVVYSPINNKIYVFGGQDATSGTTYNLNRIYDIATGTWSAGAVMPDVRSFFAGAVYYNTKIYLIGGYTNGQVTSAQNQVWEYDPIANTYTTTRLAMPLSTGGSASQVINGKIYIAGGRDASNSVDNTLYIYDVAANTWTTGANLPAFVNVPGSAAIGNKLWIFGGGNPFLGRSTAISKARVAAAPETDSATYIYDPAANSWTAGPSLNTARSFPGSATVGGNIAVAYGGYTGSSTTNITETNTAAVCTTPTSTTTSTSTASSTTTNTATATRTSTASSTSTSTVTNSATATRTSTASSTVTNTAVNTNTSTATSSSTSTSTSTRTNTAVPTSTNTVTVTVTATACSSGPANWVVRTPAAIDSYGASGAGDGTYAYFAGGYSFTSGQTLNQFVRFNPATNSWTSLTNMSQTLVMAGVVYSPINNKVYVFGGQDAVSGTTYNLNQVYDIATGTWSAGAAMPDVRAFFASSVYYNGKIYLIGGYTDGQVTSSQAQVWEYDPITNTYSTSRLAMPHAFGGAGSAVINGKIYVAGGRDANVTVLDTLYIYDIAANTWTTGANLPVVENVPGSAAIGNRFWIFGGGNPFRSQRAAAVNRASQVQSPQTDSTMYIYDPAANSWTTGPSLNNARSFPGSATVGGSTVVVYGGYTGSGTTAATESNTAGSCGTATSTPTAGSPTATSTNTTVPTASSTSTNTAVATSTNTPTNTPIAPSSTSTNTPTNTAVAPSSTPTNTAVNTATNTAVVPTATQTTSPTNTTEPSATPTVCVMNFTDVTPDDWFYGYVEYLYCRGVVTGYNTNPPCTAGFPCFKPENNTTRGQMAKIVVLAFELPIDTTGGPHFTDVPTTHTFYPYIETGRNLGLFGGYPDGTYRPGNYVTRGQLSKIIVNAAVLTDPANWTLLNPATNTFQDVLQGTTFYTYIETAYAHQIIEGYPCGTLPAGPCVPPGNKPYFLPSADATRAQISKITFLAVTYPPSR